MLQPNWYGPQMGQARLACMMTISNTFVMMILFVYVAILSVLFADENLQIRQMG